MRNPPTQNVAMAPSQSNVQAVHVKGECCLILLSEMTQHHELELNIFNFGVTR